MGKANIGELMTILKDHHKAKNNNNVRQTLNSNKNLFVKDGFGNYSLYNNKNSVVSIYA